jgi:hypothetical protein
MSLLPAAMRLPNDITPLGRKVEKSKPVPVVIDHVKEFETLQHPYPNGVYPKPPLGPKPFFGFDFGAADMTSMVINEVYKAALLSANPPMVLTQEPKGRTAVEIVMKQRAATERKNLDWFDLDHEVGLASKRSGTKEVHIARSVRNAFGGGVERYQIESAITYVRAMY